MAVGASAIAGDSANTYATTMMIAEKALDLIRGLAPLAPAVPSSSHQMHL